MLKCLLYSKRIIPLRVIPTEVEGSFKRFLDSIDSLTRNDKLIRNIGITVMPLTKSAKKALAVSKRRKLENDKIRARVKGATKGVRIGVKSGAADNALKLQLAYRELDMAAKKKVIHKNKASRLKSRLAKAVAATPVVAEAKPKKAKAVKKAK